MLQFLEDGSSHQLIIVSGESAALVPQYMWLSEKLMATNLGRMWQFLAVNWTVWTATNVNFLNWNCREQFYIEDGQYMQHMLVLVLDQYVVMVMVQYVVLVMEQYLVIVMEQ